MRLSHSFLTLSSAAGLWMGGHLLWALTVSPEEAKAPPPVFAVARSGYGSLMARMMRDSLFSYWHGGQDAAAHREEAKVAPPSTEPPPQLAGKFVRKVKPPPTPHEDEEHEHHDDDHDSPTGGNWITRKVVDLARLEAGRTKRNSAFPISAAHKRFVSAEADWRLRLAYQLDPGDAVLYEILHFHMTGRLAQKPEFQTQLLNLADQAIRNVDMPDAGMWAALTGAGAAVNLLNDLLRPGQVNRDDAEILRRWGQLDHCLNRYRVIHQQAIEEGWWEPIPEVRRVEIEEHAKMLGRIADTIRQQLPAAKVSVDIRHFWQGQPLPLAKQGLRNAAGNTLSVTRLAYLLSNAKLQKPDGTWIGASDWFAYVDVEKGRTQLVLPKVPRGKYTALRFDLGLDEKANKGDPAKWPADHPLNPALNSLHWSWKGGYVFVALEGHHRQIDGKLGGYSYHLAGEPCRGTIEVPAQLDLSENLRLTLSFDVDRLFSAAHVINIQVSSSTHSSNDGGLAERIADNAVQAFGLLGVSPDFGSEGCREVVGEGNVPPVLAAHVPSHFPLTSWPADNVPTPDGVALGQRLFEEQRLSINNAQSCASCHVQGLAFADPRAVSLGAEGQVGSRNAMPLVNLAWKPSFFWDGRSPTLRDQVLRPIQDPNEMKETLPGIVAKLSADPGYVRQFEKVFGSATITADRVARALEQYLLTLVSGSSKLDLAHQGKTKLSDEEQRGFALFFTESDPARGVRGADCFHCHGGAHFTNNQFANNGLDGDGMLKDIGRAKVTNSDADRGKFMVPSLRNVALTAPYMHDGRFKTLDEVIEHYDHGVQRSQTLDPNLAKHLETQGLNLSAGEKQALIAFLKTLTDTSFIAKPSPLIHARSAEVSAK